MTYIKLFMLACALLFAAGCASPAKGPYAAQVSEQRDTCKAHELTARAVELMEEDADQAEDLLRQALCADLFHGPAHNNLGVLHLRRHLWYEAASEFEWARKLMPGHPDPRMNLALTLERAGRLDEALATYRSALEVYQGHIPTMQALARLQIRSGQTDDRTPEMLKEIALAGENEQWRTWARRQMLEFDSDESSR